jgi:hypothetical protein
VKMKTLTEIVKKKKKLVGGRGRFRNYNKLHFTERSRKYFRRKMFELAKGTLNSW